MYTSFYIEDKRYEELKDFIRTELTTARFASNPLREGNKWHICLTLEVQEGNKLNQLMSKWEEENALQKVKNKESGFFSSMRNLFN
jgi:hypothetical protein